MTNDKFGAVWVSYTSLTDFTKCPRAYYLKNVYKDPKTGHRMQIMSPPLALGQAVHEVIESLSLLPTDRRLSEPLLIRFEEAWQKISGKQGGFVDNKVERKYKDRGMAMLQRIIRNPGPIKGLAVKIKADLPSFWLSEEDNIVLCGKIDWLEYDISTDSVHIIDFKTSKSVENPKSLQLLIYYLLAKNCQKRPVTKGLLLVSGIAR